MSDHEPVEQVDLQLHEQYAINNNAILGSMLSIFGTMLAVIGTYGYVFIHTGTELCIKSENEFSLVDLIYTASAAILVLTAIAWLCIILGYRQRKEQFIIYSIRRKYYDSTEKNRKHVYEQIYPNGYNPLGKGLIEVMQFPYDTFLWFSIITGVVVLISLIFKSFPMMDCAYLIPIVALIVTLALAVICIIYKLFSSYKKYLELEEYYKELKNRTRLTPEKI